MSVDEKSGQTLSKFICGTIELNKLDLIVQPLLLDVRPVSVGLIMLVHGIHEMIK